MSTTPLFKKVDSGDYINYKKRAAIAGEYSTANTNPVKINGNQYNKNFTFIPTLHSDISHCLISAQSYALKQDYTFGVNYLDKVCDASGN